MFIGAGEVEELETPSGTWSRPTVAPIRRFRRERTEALFGIDGLAGEGARLQTITTPDNGPIKKQGVGGRSPPPKSKQISTLYNAEIARRQTRITITKPSKARGWEGQPPSIRKQKKKAAPFRQKTNQDANDKSATSYSKPWKPMSREAPVLVQHRVHGVLLREPGGPATRAHLAGASASKRAVGARGASSGEVCAHVLWFFGFGSFSPLSCQGQLVGNWKEGAFFADVWMVVLMGGICCKA